VRRPTPRGEGRAVVSSCPFFTPSRNSEEDWKEEEADGDDHHVDEEINHAVSHDIAET